MCESRMGTGESAERVQKSVPNGNTDIERKECNWHWYKSVRREHSDDDRCHIFKKDCTEHDCQRQQNRAVNRATGEVGEKSEHMNRFSVTNLLPFACEQEGAYSKPYETYGCRPHITSGFCRTRGFRLSRRA